MYKVFFKFHRTPIIWRRGDRIVTSGERLELRDSNTTLVIKPVKLIDEGDWTCETEGASLRHILKIEGT